MIFNDKNRNGLIAWEHDTSRRFASHETSENNITIFGIFMLLFV